MSNHVPSDNIGCLLYLCLFVALLVAVPVVQIVAILAALAAVVLAEVRPRND